MKRFFRWAAISTLTGILLVFGYVAVNLFPLISGFGAKNLCSCVFVGGQKEEDVRSHELGTFPISIGSFTINPGDSSATGSVIGIGKKKAVYRKGLGCTLISEISEEDLRKQVINIERAIKFNPDTTSWPLGNKQAEDTADHPGLNDLVKRAFEDPSGKNLRNMRAVLIVHRGKIIAEQYGDGYDQNTRHQGWSMAKSLFNNAMVGILTKQDRMKSAVSNYIPEWSHDERSLITVDNLLHCNSGLKWEESYSGKSDATMMLYSKHNMGEFASSKYVEGRVGKRFQYSSGTANILSLVVRNELGKDYYNYPYNQLYDKLGMFSLVIEPDAGGTFVSSSYAMATARDWARFGLFYLNNGKAGDEQILPENWVAASSRPDSSATYGQYGMQFWLNVGPNENPQYREYPDVPREMFWADGYRGQRVFIIPSKDLVIVKLCYSTGDYLDENEFLADVIKYTDQAHLKTSHQYAE